MKSISTILTNKKNIFHIDDVNTIDQFDLLHWHDSFDPDEMNHFFKVKGTPAFFLNDYIINCENFNSNVQFIGLPLWLEKSRKFWNLEEFNNKKIETKYCFNFMINKKQINRYLCIKLVEVLKLDNFIYTWSGVDNYFDCGKIINEYNDIKEFKPLTADQFGQILSPITLDPIFFYNGIEDLQNTGASLYNYGGNRNSWDWGCNKLFLHSAVALITESLSYQKASMFTEKTLYSILGCNFPIWVGGGNRQAEMFKKLGFDAFEDVINHDYQHYDTLLERCVYAFTLNNKILTDFEFARAMRNLHRERLENNRNLLFSGILSNYINVKLEEQFANNHYLDDSFKSALGELLKHFKVDNSQLELP